MPAVLQLEVFNMIFSAVEPGKEHFSLNDIYVRDHLLVTSKCQVTKYIIRIKNRPITAMTSFPQGVGTSLSFRKLAL